MLKSFKLITSVILVTASTFGAVAQTETYKDVVLEGKPAKLNLKTGVITYNDGTIANSFAARKIKDSVIESNTVIKKNPIFTDSKLDSINTILEEKITQTKSDSTNVTYTDKPNTLVNYYKNKKLTLASDTVMTTQTVFITSNSSNIDTTEAMGTIKIPESELFNNKEEAMSKGFEVSKPSHYNDTTSNFHKVLKGETLYIISQRYQTSLGALKKANNLETTLITIGQILQIKNFDATSVVQTLNRWTVSKGDTLYSIAKRNNISVASIKSLNGLESDLIKIGQILQIK